ncbi:Nitric oxide synthase, brain, partial [Halocaridina rubra]
MFDVLPLVVSAPTGPPEIFIIPEDKILRVPLSHPKFEWFKDLKMEWFGLPSVTSMMLDIGGIQFPCAPFNGWYTSPEIGTRNLCDVQRYNLNQFFGEKFGLDTRSPTTLWKDKVALELNIAVLHSFKERGVVIVDQHTVAETFMQFYHNEHRQRGGCPADWVWIVPPISGALTPVFHQEMSVYYLKPSYDYQPEGWVSFQKQNKMLSGEMDQHERFNPVQKFKKIIFAVVFASTLYSAALARRVRIAVLYATETGKAEVFANALTNVLSLNFNPEVICMADYDVSKLSDENLVVVIASTTGSGEPPQNGQEFTKKLFYLREKDIDNSEHNRNAKQDMIITNGEADQKKPSSETVGSYNKMNAKRTSFLIKANGGENEDPDDQGRINKWKLSKPADKIPYVVFALGSRDYENFCAFGKYIHHLLFTSGGNPLLDLTFGDEATNQQEAFNNWTSQLLKVCCDKFQVKNTTSGITSTEKIIRKDQVKFEAHHNPPTLSKTLSKVHGKYVSSCSVLENQTLYENGEKWYQKIIINTNEEKTLQYQPGDHVGVVPANNQSTVSEIISRLDNCPDPDIPVQVYLKLETDDCWFPHPMLSVASIRHLLSRILDIVAVPSPTILRLLANSSSNNIHRSRLNELASNRNEYSHWKKENQFTLLDVLLEFPSVRIDAALLLSRLPLLQPRLYSISSSSDISPNQLCLTVASVSYRTKGGKGTLRKGICTSYLKSLKPGDTIEIFHRSAPGYHLPEDNLAPLILLGSGSGVAPFRGFWQQLQHNSKAGIHEVVLYYGCQTRACDLYNEEKTSLCNSRILMRTHLALSRDPVVPKTYVQDLFVNHAKELYEKLVWRKGHIYVCGSEGLATGIYLKLLAIIQDQAKANSDEAHSIIRQMK